jgi:hypothetical protein
MVSKIEVCDAINIQKSQRINEDVLSVHGTDSHNTTGKG